MLTNAVSDVAVVIPAYNEAATVQEVARLACTHGLPVIVVDDGSQDATAQVLAGLPVTLLRNGANQGKAAALWRGMRYAVERGARAVLTIDADGQHRPDDIPRLVEAWRARPGSIIVGARVRNRGAIPRLRRFAQRMANFWISWAAAHAISDTQSGFRVYPAGLLKDLRVRTDRAHGFVFESEILIEAARLGIHTHPVPIEAIYLPGARRSRYRPAADTVRIVGMVAGHLLHRRLHPGDLLRSLNLPGFPPRHG